MKKRMLFGLMSAGLLLATSCTNENLFSSETDATSMVSFQIATPEIATRAYSDGTTATKLEYAVYDEAGNILAPFTAIDDDAKTIDLTQTVNFQLTTDNTYTVIFWASNAAAPYDFNPVTKEVTVDYTGVTSNNENYDAFFACETFTVTERVQVEEITLKRPFAQLNIGASDYAASALAGYTPTHSYVKVSNIYNTLNLWDGSVTNATEVAFNFADIKRDEVFPVAGYEYIAMNYLLVSKDKELVDIEFKYTDNAESINKENTKTRAIGSVPVQRNYRTNIYGDLFTSDVDVKVTIDPIYNDWSNDIFYAFEMGGEVTLTQDTKVAHTLYVRSGVNATLNLNGFTLTNNVKDQDDNTTANKTTDVIVVEEGATLTINGEGTIEAVSGFDGYAVIAEGTVIINGGTYKAGVDENGEANAIVYARGNGKVYVNGGTFLNDHNSVYVLNKKDADRATTTIEVSGGTFYNFNPANNAAEGAGTNFVVEPYLSVEVEKNVWVVRTDDIYVRTSDEFDAALAAGYRRITLGNDILLTADNNIVTSDLILDLNGFDLTTDRNYSSGQHVGNISVLCVSGADMKVVGEGSIVNIAATGAYAIAVYDGAIVTIEGNVTVGAYYDAYYVKEGSLFIKSGYHYAAEDVLPTDPDCTLNYTPASDCHRSTVINCYDPAWQTGEAIVSLTGGTFVNMDPSNVHEGQLHNQTFVADGYKVETVAQTDGSTWYNVVAE